MNQLITTLFIDQPLALPGSAKYNSFVFHILIRAIELYLMNLILWSCRNSPCVQTIKTPGNQNHSCLASFAEQWNVGLLCPMSCKLACICVLWKTCISSQQSICFFLTVSLSLKLGSMIEKQPIDGSIWFWCCIVFPP